MESSGERAKIHVSKETADLLIAAGKSSWVKPRETMVEAKGRGALQTFWVNTHDSSLANTSVSEELAAMQHTERTQRLIEWNVDRMIGLLKDIAVRREAMNATRIRTSSKLQISSRAGANTLDEVVEIIGLPKFDGDAAKKEVDAATIELHPKVRSECL